MKRAIFIFGLTMLMGLTVIAQKKKEGAGASVNINYCLPKVSYEVKVTLESIESIPGPYRKHAEKELGQKPDITERKELWSIKNIEVKPQFIPDEKAIYSVSANADYHSIMLSLSAEGFLAGVSGGKGGIFNDKRNMVYAMNNSNNETIDVTDFNNFNMKELLDTNYTYQEVDGEMKKIWDPISRYVPKTEDDNVKEAISEIIRIRSERVKLLGAENGVPDGKSLEIILQEFDEMEQNYLSLFLGKQIKRKVVKIFMCTPEKSGESIVAFRFTEDGGIAPAKNVTAPAYTLKVENSIVPASTPVAGETAEAAIFYRVPATADVKLLKANDEILSFKAIIPQLGEIKKFPVSVIANENLMLEFYPEYGALKSVVRK